MSSSINEDLLEKYSSLKQELKDLNKTLGEVKTSLDEHIATREKMQVYLHELSAEREKEINRILNEFKDKEKQKIEEYYTSYYDELLEYKTAVSNEMVRLKVYIQNCGFLDNSEYHEKLKAITKITDKISGISEKIASKSLVDLYEKQGYGFGLSEIDIDSFLDWLTYFENYDRYDAMLGTVAKSETKLWKNFDSTLVFLGIFIFGVCCYNYPIFTIFPYLVLIIATLYLRIREFYAILELLGIYGFLKNQTEILKSDNKKQLEEIVNRYDAFLGEHNQKYEDIIKEISLGIDEAKLKEITETLSNFNEDEAKQKAEEMIENNGDDIQEKLKEEEAFIEEQTQKFSELNNKYLEMTRELNALREQIKETYENLVPSFSSNKMLESFFLGFKNDEPTLFEYNGEPCAIFYSAKAEETKMVMSTIKMMCCQIMTTMNPLAYEISVVDLLTGGADLASFQVTDTNEEKMEVSNIFHIIGTNEECKELLTNIYREYAGRRIKVLGRYPSIREYNIEKEQDEARTLGYKISFFYEYDYNLLMGDSNLRQLCRISKSIGFCFFFMINVDTFEPPNNKKGDKKATFDNIYKYRYEDLVKLLTIFGDKNVFSFKFSGDDIDIINTTKNAVLQRVEGEN